MSQNPGPQALVPDDERARLAHLARRSAELILEHQAPTGAYPASPTFSAYRGYAWYRDGSFTAEGMSRWGALDSVHAFHSWAARVLTDRAGLVEELAALRERGETPGHEQVLPCRFTLDGREGEDPWWNFQTDGYGTWLWALATHVRRHGVDPSPWRAGAKLAVRYLASTWDLPCFDWWEEHDEHRHTSTLGAIYGGLRAAVSAHLLDDPDIAALALATAEQVRERVLAEGVTSGRAPARGAAPGDAPRTGAAHGDEVPRSERPHLAKWLGSGAVDASLTSCVVPFGLLEPGSELAAATIDAVAADLDVEGGVYRFRADVFFGGGRWPLLSCFLGWNLAARGDLDGALRHLRWAAAQAAPDGAMPEQVDGHLLAPEHRQEWLDRWGPVAQPLLWSHGMFLVLADELGLLPQERP